jgi:hypothetical protein
MYRFFVCISLFLFPVLCFTQEDTTFKVDGDAGGIHVGNGFISIYDLNGIKREMTKDYQKDESTGVELTVKPGFVYDEGVPYLQLRHMLHNVNNFAVTGQRFGASADVMIHKNDLASLLLSGLHLREKKSNIPCLCI